MSEAEGAIIAALIAGWVAFFSLIISKEQTVSDFRQQWIDELRKDIAMLVALVSSIHGESISKKESQQPLWDRVKEDVNKFNEVTARIRLRLNPKEKRRIEGPATKQVLEGLNKLQAIFASRNPNFQEFQPLLTTVVEQTQVILKENWKRVRSGEPIYWITKWITFAVAAAALAWLGRRFL